MNNFKGRGGFLNSFGIFLVLPSTLFFVVEAFIFKSFQLGNINGKTNIADAFMAFAPDLAVGLILFLFFAVLASHKRRLIAYGSLFIFGLLLSAMLVLFAASHGYFLSTGSHLSAAAISYWLENTADTNKIIATDAMTWRLPLLIAQPVLVLAFIVTVILPPVRLRLQRRGNFSLKSFLVIGITLLVLAGMAIMVPPLKGSGKALSRCVPLSIAVDWMVESTTDLEDESVAQADNETLDRSQMSEIEFEVEEGAPRPNIVFIIFESLNWKSSDVYFPGKGTTPFLGELAKDALVIDRHYTVVPHTSKALIPMLCGIQPYLQTVGKESTPGIIPRKCIGHVLQSQGYKTAFFQPAQDFEKRSLLTLNMGFETFRGLDDMSHKGFEKISYFGREDMMMLKPSLDWMESAGDQPFYATFLTLSSHHNYVTPQSFPVVDYPTDDPDQDNYLNAVRYVDSFIEALISGMRERGLDKNTVFFIVGDHGEAFGEHGRRQHDLIMWEEGLRSAALIYSPKYFKAHSRIEGVRSHLDFLPTVCDILKLTPKEETMMGTSLLRPAIPNRRLLHACWFNRQCMALREGNIKTIYHYGLQEMEVFDNAVDQFDEKNLAGLGPYDEKFLASKKDLMFKLKKESDAKYNSWGRRLLDGAVHKKAPELSQKVTASFGEYIDLVGFEMSPKKPTAGSAVTLKYAFKCKKKMSPTSAMFVHITSKGHAGFINADHVPARGALPTKKWEPGSYILDEQTVHIPAGWAGRTAKIALGFWDTKTKGRLDVTAKDLKVNDRRLFVKSFKVAGKSTMTVMSEQELRDKIELCVSLEKPEFQEKVGVVFGDSVELVGISKKRVITKQAGTVEMDYVFKMLKKLPKSWSLTVELIKKNGAKINGNHVPVGGLYPSGKWIVNEYIVDRHKIHIDMHKVKPGQYKAWLGFKDGKHHIPASGPGVIDDKGRYFLGDVEILKKTEKQ